MCPPHPGGLGLAWLAWLARLLWPGSASFGLALLDLGLRYGPYGAAGLSLDKLKAEPHGVDLGPLQPRLPERLFTIDQHIELVPDLFVQDLARVQAVFKPSEVFKTSEGYDLMLIGRRELRSNNSWMHNSERLMRGKDRCTLLMHPIDAAVRALVAQQSVTVASRVGQVTLPLEISDEVMPGVVSMPHGWGHDRAGVRLRVAQRRAGVSINDLTDEVFLGDNCVHKLLTGRVSEGFVIMHVIRCSTQ